MFTMGSQSTAKKSSTHSDTEVLKALTEPRASRAHSSLRPRNMVRDRKEGITGYPSRLRLLDRSSGFKWGKIVCYSSTTYRVAHRVYKRSSGQRSTYQTNFGQPFFTGLKITWEIEEDPTIMTAPFPSNLNY
jgi:hypothetical protein